MSTPHATIPSLMGYDALLSPASSWAATSFPYPRMLCPPFLARTHQMASCQENPPKDNAVHKVEYKLLLVFKLFSHGFFLCPLRPRPPA